MGVVQAKMIQTVEDVYRLIRTAVMSKRPERASHLSTVGIDGCAHIG